MASLAHPNGTLFGQGGLNLGTALEGSLNSGSSSSPPPAEVTLERSRICYLPGGPTGQQVPQIVDLYTELRTNEAHCGELVSRYFTEFTAAFPDESSRSTKNEFLRDLKDPRFNVLIAKSGDSIVGGLHWWHLNCGVGVEEHIWVAPAMRHMSMGRALDQTLARWLDLSACSMLVSEMQDPRKATSRLHHNECIARTHFFHQRGRLWIAAPFFAPALRTGETAGGNLVLTVQHLGSALSGTATHLEVSEYLKIIGEYFQAIVPEVDHSELIDRHRICLKKIKGKIPLRPMNDLLKSPEQTT